MVAIERIVPGTMRFQLRSPPPVELAATRRCYEQAKSHRIRVSYGLGQMKDSVDLIPTKDPFEQFLIFHFASNHLEPINQTILD